MPYQLLADAVLVLHFSVVVFVIGGLVAIIVGNRRQWRWVNGWWFRLAHLFAIACVMLQAWLGLMCPLTVLESWLRVGTGTAPYERSFVEHWFQRLLYYDAPPWLFTLAYSVFALAVIVAWWRYPPRARGTRGGGR